jgi:hypothetical protein
MRMNNHRKHELAINNFFVGTKVWNPEKRKSAKGIAKRNGDQLKQKMFLNIDDALKYVLKNESFSK